MVQKMLDKTYDPKITEQKIYKIWERSGYFNPDKLPPRHRVPYTIMLPPPNITGSLHMGHALNVVIQDGLTRYKRMKGFRVLWLPGTDHAGIATQNVIEKQLKKEGKTRHDIGRAAFERRAWAWREESGNTILNQLKRLGASADWSRTRFTLDEEYENAVLEAFMHYYKKGWIYRDYRVINWCPRCATSISDLELEYHEEKGTLWYIKYPLTDGAGSIMVATTRPETMLGDAAIAVNPKDERYKKFIGKQVILPIQEKKIPIIGDTTVDPSFGTGAVKVTPLHDTNDWGIAQRHNLKGELIIDERRKMTRAAGPMCEGLNTRDCREKVLQELKTKGLLDHEEKISHAVPYCHRCNTMVEPLASMQWFMKMQELSEMALEALKKKEVIFTEKKWGKIYMAWLEQKRDWSISRQLWWGHRLPVWFHEPKCIPIPGREDEVEQCVEMIVAKKKPLCRHCAAIYVQSEDVLDTWFSSALWPFATLGWPKKTKDLKTYYPTAILVTARDIINLWVGRMVYSSYEFFNQPPFAEILVHATVLTRDGRRMSKSLGTGIDPLELIEQYGADATRFGLAYQMMGGQDIRFAEEHIVMGKKFCNKLWNGTRFVLMQLEGQRVRVPTKEPRAYTTADKKILKALKVVIRSTEDDLARYRFGPATHTLYNFFWHAYADVYIEKSKIQLTQSKTQQEKKRTLKILLYVHSTILKLFHPFVPFITEELYGHLPHKEKKSLIIETWPQ